MNKKRYWLRGGIAGLVISATWALQGTIRNGLEHANKYLIISNLIIAIFLAITVGAVIGWLYGKIKSRNSSQSQSNV